IVGNHHELAAPLDLALLPVNEDLWKGEANFSRALRVDQLAVAHQPVPGEVLFFAGYSGDRSSFQFGTLFNRGTGSMSREVDLPPDDRFHTRFHFGIDYKPDLAVNAVGTAGLPRPPGFSGSTVWNTRFVESRMSGLQWSPDMALVTGVVWGW